MKINYFSKIAMCMPGGGFRAASYSLGMLSFLNKIEMLDKLKSISTVSGGTITGAKYAESVVNKITFDKFFEIQKDWLENGDLLNKSLNNLEDKNLFSYKRQNLINSFSLVYSKFIPLNFGELEEKLKNSNSLKEVIFNSTDFEYGLQFRFRTKPGRFGNGNNEFGKYKHNIQLGDIVAASSCFPGGFEPMSFPNDFMKIDPEHELWGKEPIGLMDGGILDNLGILSYLTGKSNYDTFIVGDAGKDKINGFDFAENSKIKKYISNIFSWWSLLTITVLTGLSYYFNLPLYIFLPLFGILFLLSTLQLVLQLFLTTASDNLNLDKSISLPRNKIGLYIADRLLSLIHMNNSIFLKGTKRSNLKLMYEIKNDKVCHTPVYKFSKETQFNDKLSELGITIPKKLKTLSDYCSQIETTLWFTKKHQRNDAISKLILCGEASCCYSLMESMIKRSKNNYLDLKTNTVFKKLSKEWRKIIK